MAWLTWTLICQTVNRTVHYCIVKQYWHLITSSLLNKALCVPFCLRSDSFTLNKTVVYNLSFITFLKVIYSYFLYTVYQLYIDFNLNKIKIYIRWLKKNYCAVVNRQTYNNQKRNVQPFSIKIFENSVPNEFLLVGNLIEIVRKVFSIKYSINKIVN